MGEQTVTLLLPRVATGPAQPTSGGRFGDASPKPANATAPFPPGTPLSANCVVLNTAKTRCTISPFGRRQVVDIVATASHVAGTDSAQASLSMIVDGYQCGLESKALSRGPNTITATCKLQAEPNHVYTVLAETMNRLADAHGVQVQVYARE